MLEFAKDALKNTHPGKFWEWSSDGVVWLPCDTNQGPSWGKLHHYRRAPQFVTVKIPEDIAVMFANAFYVSGTTAEKVQLLVREVIENNDN